MGKEYEEEGVDSVSEESDEGKDIELGDEEEKKETDDWDTDY